MVKQQKQNENVITVGNQAVRETILKLHGRPSCGRVGRNITFKAHRHFSEPVSRVSDDNVPKGRNGEFNV